MEPGRRNFRAALNGSDAWKVARYDISMCNDGNETIKHFLYILRGRLTGL
jgi:hypothetical protein